MAEKWYKDRMAVTGTEGRTHTVTAAAGPFPADEEKDQYGDVVYKIGEIVIRGEFEWKSTQSGTSPYGRFEEAMDQLRGKVEYLLQDSCGEITITIE